MKKKLYLSSLLLTCLSLCSLGARAQAPVVTTDPHDTTVCTGTTTRFYTQATGAGVTYMWLESTDAGATWDTAHNGAVYSGATTDTLRVITSLTMDGYMYKGVAMNISGQDTSLAATLGVDDAPVAGVIVGVTNLCVGSTATLSNAAPGGVWTNTNPAVSTLHLPSLVLEALTAGRDTIIYTVTNTCGTASATAPYRVDAPGVSPITGPTATCVGNVITLMSASADGTGVWSSSNTAVGTISGTAGSASFTAIAAGTTVVSYSFTNTCGTYGTTLSITVQSPLTTPTISGTNMVCVGSWTSLTGAPTGGIWISSSSSTAVVDMSGNVTGISQGTAVISYLMSNACGAVLATDTVTVFAPAAAITGASDSVGIGNTLTLSNATADGTWSSADITIASIGSTGIVTGLDTGITTISYTVTNICGTSVATYTLNVGPAPSAGTLSGSNPDSVCVGGNKTFTSTVTGGVWTMVNPRATVSAAGVVTGVTYGMDTLVYTVSNAFGTSEARKRIFVNWAHVDSVKGPNVPIVGGSYDIVGYPIGGTWSQSATSVDTVALINASSIGHVVVVKPGLVKLTYTIQNSCGTDTMILTIGVPPANGVVDMANEAFLNIYPNPATEVISLNLQTAVSQDATVTITNMIGEKVKELVVKTNNATEIRLDQPAGIYFVTAKTATGTYTSKVSIAK